MSLYPVERILALYPDDPKKADELFHTQDFDTDLIEDLVQEFGEANIDPSSTKEVLLTMLRHIPPDKQKRVIDRIASETKSRGFNVVRMYWWDIQPHWRNLRFLLNRDGFTIPVTLMWRKTDPSISSLFTPSTDWIPDKEGSIGFGIEFHFEAYQHLKPAFLHWLRSPLTLPFQQLSQSA